MSKNQNRWPSTSGRKPGTKELRFVHELNLARTGTKAAVAVAMLVRPTGATQREIKEAVGSFHRNKVKQVLENRKELKLEELGHDGSAKRARLTLRGRNGKQPRNGKQQPSA